jgi:hypothetical protein
MVGDPQNASARVLVKALGDDAEIVGKGLLRLCPLRHDRPRVVARNMEKVRLGREATLLR